MENSKLNEKELEQVTGGEDFSVRKDLYENIIIGNPVRSTQETEDKYISPRIEGALPNKPTSAFSTTVGLIPEEERLP